MRERGREEGGREAQGKEGVTDPSVTIVQWVSPEGG